MDATVKKVREIATTILFAIITTFSLTYFFMGIAPICTVRGMGCGSCSG